MTLVPKGLLQLGKLPLLSKILVVARVDLEDADIVFIVCDIDVFILDFRHRVVFFFAVVVWLNRYFLLNLSLR